MRTNLTMQKECAATVITETGGSRNLGAAITRNFMLLACAKIATLTITTGREERSLVNYREKKRRSQV